MTKLMEIGGRSLSHHDHASRALYPLNGEGIIPSL